MISKTPFLDSIREKYKNAQDRRKGKCATCGNVINVVGELYGCTAHDKIILPDYPPYPLGTICSCTDWIEREDTEQ